MNISMVQLFNVLKEFYSEEEIFKASEFRKDLFFKNLENYERGNITQLALKQFNLMMKMTPANVLNELMN